MSANSLTTNNWLQAAVSELKQAGIETARLDCLVLLEDVLGKDKSYILAHPEVILSSPNLEELRHAIDRRLTHEPLAYIRGKAEFYGREFKITHDTLQPRPETETIIDLFKQMTALYFPHLLEDRHAENGEKFLVVDVGTGSGCVGVTAKLEVPGVDAVAVDVSEDCLGVAQENAELLGANVKFLMGDLLEPVLDQKIDVLLCNLPYVPDEHAINQAATFEPDIALFGGKDGLDLYRKMFEQIEQLPSRPTHIFAESLPIQQKELEKIATAAGYMLTTSQDFVQHFTL